MSDCKHEQITSWVLTETQTPAEFWSCANCGVKFVPITEQLRLASEAEALRAALRALVVSELGGYCTLCESHWIVRDPERHRPTCLAAPKGGA